ncbi:MAG: tetratricopeptide repeat protein [Acidobacteria bacterium]|nr:tetratricopeptide repeat protein [Acidobacteriota bacterium]
MIDWKRYHEIGALRESGHPTEALAELKKLREGLTDVMEISSILLGEALSYRDLGRLDEAADAASDAMKLLPEESPSRPYAEFSLACIHEKSQKFDLATQEFKSLLKKHEELLTTNEHIQLKRNIQLRLIANLIVLGHAIEPLAIADTLKMEDISVEERAELSYREAKAHELLGGYSRALELYQEAIRGSLERSLAARSHFHIGEILYDRGEFLRALDEFRIAETMADPESPDKDHFAKWIKHTLHFTGRME